VHVVVELRGHANVAAELPKQGEQRFVRPSHRGAQGAASSHERAGFACHEILDLFLHQGRAPLGAEVKMLATRRGGHRPRHRLLATQNTDRRH
jgi:hypothetical protein